ncbi:MarR family winged helix-turn-helix transcriptional regulator [Streptomyces sp. NPDC059637]|uniref:MarR family winged helix-turn-helix transcriptional regulator n=1 Tax=Streptomyces sp. NPDC059637 TaxID=3347752 RepID=UPI00369C14BA
MTADAVDGFLAQWAKQRPDLDVSPMGVIGRLSRASRLLGRGLKDCFAAEGLESWEFDVLATLLRSGPPHTLSPKDLVAATMAGSAAMTNRVDRLVARNLVTREVDPGNRRRLLVSLTPEGLALVNHVVERHVANERRLLEGLDPSEREEMERLLRKLLLSLGDTLPPTRP